MTKLPQNSGCVLKYKTSRVIIVGILTWDGVISKIIQLNYLVLSYHFDNIDCNNLY